MVVVVEADIDGKMLFDFDGKDMSGREREKACAIDGFRVRVRVRVSVLAYEVFVVLLLAAVLFCKRRRSFSLENAFIISCFSAESSVPKCCCCCYCCGCVSVCGKTERHRPTKMMKFQDMVKSRTSTLVAVD